jgi:hypothetical protein
MLHRYSLGNEGERLGFEAVAITYYNQPMSIKGVINGSKEQLHQHQERRYHQCRKGCGQVIYFDANSKTESGKWFPLGKETGESHQRH